MKGLWVLGCILIILGVSILGSWGITRIVNEIQFDQNCEGYLKQSADANNIPLAKERLAIAIIYIEKNNLTSGFTSIIYRTPDEDMGFWYKNLKESLDGLSNIKSTATDLEKSNMLMKLRETLLDQGNHGTNVTCPVGISIYPNNTIYCIIGVFGLVLLTVGIIFLKISFDY